MLVCSVGPGLTVRVLAPRELALPVSPFTQKHSIVVLVCSPSPSAHRTHKLRPWIPQIHPLDPLDPEPRILPPRNRGGTANASLQLF